MTEFSTFECEFPMKCGHLCDRLFGHQGLCRCEFEGEGSSGFHPSIEGGSSPSTPEPEPIAVEFTIDTTRFVQNLRRAERATQSFAFSWRGGWQRLTRILRARRGL